MLKKQIPFKMFVLTIMLVACTANNTASSIKDLILPSSCTNACWTGIEPKVTNKEQVVNLLVKRYDAENVTMEVYNKESMSINWKTNQQDWSTEGAVWLFDDKVVTVSIRLEENITIKDLITSIGEPNSVNGVIGAITSSGEFKCAGITLLYPELGIEIYPSPLDDSLGISESQYITFVMISEPWKEQDIPRTDSFNIPWDGYHEYCQKP